MLGELRLAGWVGLPVGLVALIVTSLAIVLVDRSPLRAESGLVTTAAIVALLDDRSDHT